MRKYKKIKPEVRKKALIEIDGAMSLAKQYFLKGKKELAKKYVQKARRVGMRSKVRIPKEFKRSYCKHCLSYLVVGKNLTVRTHEGNVVYTCKECNRVMRFGY